MDNVKAKWGQLTAAELQELGFWNDFQKGFGSVMRPATQIASGVANAMGSDSQYGQMANQFAQMSGAVNNGVQNTQFDLQNLGFWNDFQKGFGTVMGPATQIASGVANAMGSDSQYGQMANQFAQMSGAVNNGVQNTQFDLQEMPSAWVPRSAYKDMPAWRKTELQNLGFWNDFGKGFKIGFGAVAKPASFIPGVGSIMGAANNAVQKLVPGKLDMQNLATQAQLCADYRSRCSAVGGGKYGSVSACVSDVSGGMC
jgi:hypothetical protein